ncbi:MAG TPA: type IV pilus modification protein PilV [Gammaproteobacteria bacterium]|nr:type IV pilus modification protein PilV [Gammaproteobacteria bacterium]
MIKHCTSIRFSANQGFTLIEVLVATIILAVGLLGISGMQVTGLRSNHSALMRSQATMFAYDLSDRMRANGEAFKPAAGYYNNPVAAVDNNCSTTAGCDSQAMAENDMYLWNVNIADALPAGAGIVCIDSTPDDGTSKTAAACDGIGSSYAIKIWWQDNRNAAAAFKRFVVTYL